MLLRSSGSLNRLWREEFPVFPGNGEAEEGAVVVPVDVESNPLQEDLAAIDPHLLDRRWQPADIAGLPVLCHQRPTGDALADLDFDLRVTTGYLALDCYGPSSRSRCSASQGSFVEFIKTPSK